MDVEQYYLEIKGSKIFRISHRKFFRGPGLPAGQ